MIPGSRNALLNAFGGTGGGSTWNPADKSASFTLSNGNLTGTTTVATAQGCRSTTSKNSGKVYFECVFSYTTTNAAAVGLALGSASLTGGYTQSGLFVIDGLGRLWANGGNVASAAPSPSSGVTIMVAHNFSTGKLWFGVNGTWVNSGNPSTDFNPVTVITAGQTLFVGAFSASTSSTNSWVLNAGGSAFSYSVPSGFSAWG